MSTSSPPNPDVAQPATVAPNPTPMATASATPPSVAPPNPTQKAPLPPSNPLPPSRSLGGTPLPKPGWFNRFLWFCAGADSTLLRHCPVSDWIKFQGIGGVVFATTVLAFASGSYAFYTVFSPKDQTALSETLHQGTLPYAVGAGLVWALVIFNIDRFIVSSTGKGDGTDKITLNELVQAFPRIVMAAIIGVCISAPLEIRILKPEIDAQLELEQNEYLRKLNQNADQRIQARRDELNQKTLAGRQHLESRREYFEKRRLEIKEQRRLLELEAEGRTANAIPGRGPAWRDKKETLDKMEGELGQALQEDTAANAPMVADLDAWKKELLDLAEQLKAEQASNTKQARHLDGLMKRIQISHEIGGLVPWAILLLLLAIETGPIFFKMMLTKGAYDYMRENSMRLATANLGVEVDAQVYVTETQQVVRVDVFHHVEAAMREERRRLASEEELATAVHRRFLDETKKDIDTGDGYKKYVDPS
jgi:hypothetical protein